MNDSKMSESSTSASKSRSSDVMTKYYDQYFVKTDNLSLIKLMLYTPVGLSLALVRLVLLAIFFVLLYLCPAFKNNPVFVKLVGFALGNSPKIYWYYFGQPESYVLSVNKRSNS